MHDVIINIGVDFMGTLIVLVIVAAAVALALRSMIKDKKAGKSLQCGGDCKRCGGGCHFIVL